MNQVRYFHAEHFMCTDVRRMGEKIFWQFLYEGNEPALEIVEGTVVSTLFKLKGKFLL